MPQPAVNGMLVLLGEAFEGRGIEESNESRALLTNIATVTDAEWRMTVSAATRTIESMVLHAGEINHLRSLLGTDDRWRWQQFEDPG
jgi:hypothetical protein